MKSAVVIRIRPRTNVTVSARSLKNNIETITASGILRLFNTARLPVLVFVAPRFHKKKPKLEATTPR